LPGAGTGGGFSNEFAAPPYMAEAVSTYLERAAATPGLAPPEQYNRSGRAYPDVAAFMCAHAAGIRFACAV